ncbi:uncharacterized protein [Euphorbia lathyris]|uniref:uncharacterized protein n=1 Tax=Euphorbia lathyris TaxID=212925 RepID=UPI003313BB01
MMKPTLLLCFFLLFSLFFLNHARNVPEDYWKRVVKNQPMPEAIKGLFVEDSDAVKNTHFVKDFDTRSIAVIYRSRDTIDDKIKQDKSP